jgi:hypothetical protein
VDHPKRATKEDGDQYCDGRSGRKAPGRREDQVSRRNGGRDAAPRQSNRSD